jgi:serine/threonine-protein kinase RsbW
VRIQVVMTLPREAVSVPLTRRTVAAALTAAGVEPDCLAEVEVALSEACTNVLNHAGKGDAYEVAINISDQQLRMDVIDFGSGFGQPPPHGSSMPGPTAESGRGLALMRALTDQAVFDSVSGDGGAVHLMKRLRWSPDAPLSLRVEQDGAFGDLDSRVRGAPEGL